MLLTAGVFKARKRIKLCTQCLIKYLFKQYDVNGRKICQELLKVKLSECSRIRKSLGCILLETSSTLGEALLGACSGLFLEHVL